MANKKAAEQPAEQPAEQAAEQTARRNYNERRWIFPSRRARGYAEERRSDVHQRGPKEGEKLTEYDKGLRSGYLLCQSDHAGAYKYKKALDEGKDKEEAARLSKIKGKQAA